jgi:hypothetical protein
MIDVTTEKLIGLLEINALPWLSRRRAVSTWYRWAVTGLRANDGSTVKLETVREGGRMSTTEAAVWRFFERLGAADAAARTASQQSKALERAGAMLDAAGIR